MEDFIEKSYNDSLKKTQEYGPHDVLYNNILRVALTSSDFLQLLMLILMFSAATFYTETGRGQEGLNFSKFRPRTPYFY